MTRDSRIIIGYFLAVIILIIVGYHIVSILLILGFLGYFILERYKKNQTVQKTDKGNETHDSPPAFVQHEIQDGRIKVILSTLKKEYKRGIRRRIEIILQDSLESALQVLKLALPSYTAAIFFRGKKDAFYLRAYISESDKIVEGVIINYGKGLVGFIAKDLEGRRIHEGNIISDSKTLYYYSEDQQIRSFLGVPIIVKD
ncbi:MAG: hypothetical protein ABIA63_10105, partial [bacterium]